MNASALAQLRELTSRVQIANKAAVRLAANAARIGTKEDSRELRVATIELASKLVAHLITTGEDIYTFGNNYGTSPTLSSTRTHYLSVCESFKTAIKDGEESLSMGSMMNNTDEVEEASTPTSGLRTESVVATMIQQKDYDALLRVMKKIRDASVVDELCLPDTPFVSTSTDFDRMAYRTSRAHQNVVGETYVIDVLKRAFGCGRDVQDDEY